MPTKRKPKGNRPVAGSDVDLVDGVDAENLENVTDVGLSVEANEAWLAEQFGDGTQDIAVHLYRQEPKFFDGERIDGFLGNLHVGDSLQDIKDRHGGGRYSIRQTTDKRFTAQRQVRIAGRPQVECPSPGVAAVPTDFPPDEPAQPAEPGQPVLDIGGVRMPMTDINKIKEMMLFVRMLKVAFPDPPDINAELLKVAIGGSKADSPDLLAQADQFAGLAEKLRNLVGTETGTGWLDLAGKAVESFSRYIQKAQELQPQPAAGPVPPDRIAGPTPGPAPEPAPEQRAVRPEPGPNLAERPKQPQEAEMQTGMELAEKAASYIAQGFLSEPQQTPEQTVQVLELAVPEHDRARRQELEPHRDALRMMARNMIDSQIETDEKFLADFDCFFNNVFDIFTQANTETRKDSPTAP